MEYPEKEGIKVAEVVEEVDLGLSFNTILKRIKQKPEFEVSVRKIDDNDKSIIELDLTGMKIDDNKISLLASKLPHNQNLVALNLSSNKITFAGLNVLITALKDNKILLTLNLNFNQIDFNKNWRELSTLLKQTAIIEFNLNGNKNIGQDGFLLLLSTLKENTKKLIDISFANLKNIAIYYQDKPFPIKLDQALFAKFFRDFLQLTPADFPANKITLKFIITNAETLLIKQSQTERMRTPLHYLVKNNHIEAVKYLIEQCNMNINIHDEYQQTPLFFAQDVKIIAYLIAKGADINARSHNTATVSHYYLSKGNIDSVKELLLHNPDLELAMDVTPLQYVERLAKGSVYKDTAKQMVNIINCHNLIKEGDAALMHNGINTNLSYYEKAKQLDINYYSEVLKRRKNGEAMLDLTAEYKDTFLELANNNFNKPTVATEEIPLGLKL